MSMFNSELLQGLGGLTEKLMNAKAALWVGKILSAIGLGFAAEHFIYEPLILQAQQAWGAIPAQLAAWLHALGVDVGLSMVLSAYGIRGASRIFMRRTGGD